jgi:hypothetical protein
MALSILDRRNKKLRRIQRVAGCIERLPEIVCHSLGSGRNTVVRPIWRLEK